MSKKIDSFPITLVADELARFRAQPPLVHCLTNEVVPEFTANVLLALGASPAMVMAGEESAEFAGQADTLLVNVGTLHSEQAVSMLSAVAAYRLADKPWVLDPVAVGALSYRTQFVRELLLQQPTIIRGNGSEILALAGHSTVVRGADSTDSSDAALDAAYWLAWQHRTIVAVTGQVDYVTDGEYCWSLPWGDALMTRVVGTGCALSAVVAGFCAQSDNPLNATAAACAVMAMAGGHAARHCNGPGSFVPLFLDTLYQMRPDNLEAYTHG